MWSVCIKSSMLQHGRPRHHCWTASCLQTYFTKTPHHLRAQRSARATLPQCMCMCWWGRAHAHVHACSVKPLQAGLSFSPSSVFLFALLHFSVSLFWDAHVCHDPARADSVRFSLRLSGSQQNTHYLILKNPEKVGCVPPRFLQPAHVDRRFQAECWHSLGRILTLP